MRSIAPQIARLIGLLTLALAGCNEDGSLAHLSRSRPIADAGPDQSSGVLAGDVVILDGSASSDADGDALTYAWSLRTVPPGSAAELSDPAAVDPSFGADETGTYTASLIVNDGLFGSAPDEVSITVVVPPPVVAITAPGDLSVVEASPVTVTGTVDDPAADITVNGTAVANSNGSYTAPVTLEEGSNIVTVVARNDTGEDAASVEVILDTTDAPKLTIRSPRNDFLVGEELDIGAPRRAVEVTVTGGIKVNTTDFLNNEPSVTVNGEPAEVALDSLLFSGCGLLNPFQCWRFTAIVTLDEGDHTITAVGEDNLGRRSAPARVDGIVDSCRIVWKTGNEPPEWNGEDPEVLARAGLNHDVQRNRCHEIDGCSLGSGELDDDPLPLAVCNVRPTAFGRGTNPPTEHFVHGLESAFDLPCNSHDVCYQTCVPVGGLSEDEKEDAWRAAMRACNLQQLRDAQEVCRKAYPTLICPPEMSLGCFLLGGCNTYLHESNRCFARAFDYKVGVDLFGFKRFKARQEHYCAK